MYLYDTLFLFLKKTDLISSILLKTIAYDIFLIFWLFHYQHVKIIHDIVIESGIEYLVPVLSNMFQFSPTCSRIKLLKSFFFSIRQFLQFLVNLLSALSVGHKIIWLFSCEQLNQPSNFFSCVLFNFCFVSDSFTKRTRICFGEAKS